MFFELRQYRVKGGQSDRWVKFMEEIIIPYQISKGMVVIGSFVGQEEEDLYIWIRRFESEEERERLYGEVYNTHYWRNEIDPQVAEMLDRQRTIVTRLEATPRSVVQ